jgi:predicted glutamine amidotransferase
MYRYDGKEWEFTKFLGADNNINNIIDKYNQVCEKNYDEVIVHLRYATSGDKSYDTTHPIIGENNKYVFHNGVIRSLEFDNKSDTQNIGRFYDKFMSISPEFWDNLIVNNKVIICENNKKTILYNDYLGNWINKDLWESRPN